MKTLFYINVCAAEIGHGSTDARVFREVDLPFAPTEGMFIYFGGGDSGGEFEIPTREIYGRMNPRWVYGGLSYDVTEERFHVVTDDHYNTMSVADRVAEYIQNGWSTQKP